MSIPNQNSRLTHQIDKLRLLAVTHKLRQSIEQVNLLQMQHKSLITTMIDIRAQYFKDPYDTNTCQKLENCQTLILLNIKSTNSHYKKINALKALTPLVNSTQRNRPLTINTVNCDTSTRAYSP